MWAQPDCAVQMGTGPSPASMGAFLGRGKGGGKEAEWSGGKVEGGQSHGWGYLGQVKSSDPAVMLDPNPCSWVARPRFGQTAK